MAELLKREGVLESTEVLAMNEHFVRHFSNHSLATHTFYTEGKTPEQVVAEIVEIIQK